MFFSKRRPSFSSLGKYGRTIIGILVSFGLFFPLFITKDKLFILEGMVETSAPLSLSAYIENNNTRIFSVFSAIDLKQDGMFRLEIKANNVYGLKIVFDEQDVYLKLSDFRLVGKSVRELSFKNIQTDRIGNINVSENGKVLTMRTQQKAGTVIFSDFQKLAAKRVYHITPFSLILLLPLVLACLKPSWREKGIKIFVLLLPLLLLAVVKYVSFNHAFTLYYHNLSVYNLFLLEKYEFEVFAAFYALIIAALCSKNKVLLFMTAAGLIFIFLVIFADGVILHNLNARFIFSEIKNYNTEYMAAFWMTLAYLRTQQGLLMVCCGGVLWYILKHRQIFVTKGNIIMLAVIVLLLSGVSYCYKTDFLFDYEFYNVFQANKNQKQSKRYSPDFQKQLKRSFNLKQKCHNGLGWRKNVIVVMVESLSVFTSQKAGGLYDYMPEFDKLAEKGVLLTDYYSNSYNTNGGIFSLISGLPAIHDFAGLGNMNNPALYRDSLPQKLKKSGYLTQFFTSIELNGAIHDIVALSGFDVVSDCSDSYYDDKQRFMFNAPADEHLFANVIRNIKRKNIEKPYLMVVSTISGHGPYINPETKKQSFEETVRYVDKQIKKFVDELQASRFFENGILLITGDHRAMMPVSSEERIKLAPLAEGRVPMLILGNDIRVAENGIYSHNDVAPSLQYYLTDNGCFNAFQNNIFDDKKENGCLLYQKLSPRHIVALLCDNGEADICLNGDETSFCDNRREQKYIDFVNWMRLQ